MQRGTPSHLYHHCHVPVPCQVQDTRRGTHTAHTTSSLWSCASCRIQGGEHTQHTPLAPCGPVPGASCRIQGGEHTQHTPLAPYGPVPGTSCRIQGGEHTQHAPLAPCGLHYVHACTCERVHDAFICMQLMGRSMHG